MLLDTFLAVAELGSFTKAAERLYLSPTAVMKQMNTKPNSGRILKYEGTDAEGYALFSTPAAVNPGTQKWVYNYAVGQCWYASVGIKYIFN